MAIKGTKGFNVGLNIEQQNFVRRYAMGISDDKIAVELGVSVGVVNYFRREIMGLLKTPATGKRKTICKSVSVLELENELTALQKFANYPSLMSGAKSRAKYIESVLNGIRCN